MTSDDRAEWLMKLALPKRRALITRMGDTRQRALESHWRMWAHDGQRPPPGEWHTWLIMAGRGFGKTRAGAEWVREIAEHDGGARIALVAASLGEARRVMVEGDSGLLTIASPGNRPRFEPSKRQLIWPTGAQATLYSAGEPESLRGPQHSHAWCDEIGKWDSGGGSALAVWDNLLLGLRLGRQPRVAATTTPRAIPLVRRLDGDDAVVVTRGSTFANSRHLPTGFVRTALREHGKSAWGRQELGGELLLDAEDALWTGLGTDRAVFEAQARAAGVAVMTAHPW
jgi:phage terminase large subunit-like protein